MVNYPKDWKQDKIIDVTDIFDNLRIPVAESIRVKGNTPYYGANGIQGYIKGYTHDGEFVLIAEDGASSLLDYPITFTRGKIWVNNHAHVLSGKDKILDNEYLAYALKKVNYEKIIVGGTRIKLNGSTLKAINLQYPKYTEQRKIALALNSFDTHIKNLSKLIEKKKMIRDGAVEDLVSGKKRLQGFNTEWENTPLLKIAEILNGLTYQPENVRTYGKLVLRSSNIQDDRLVFRDNVYVDKNIVNTKNVEIGDIVICVRNGSAALIGKSARINEEINATIGAFMTNIRCFNTKTSGFFYYFTKTEVFKKFVNEVLGATINQITKADFKRLKIMLPSDVKEQETIANILSSMDKEIENLEKEKEKYIQLKSGAMDDLLTGKIRLV